MTDKKLNKFRQLLAGRLLSEWEVQSLAKEFELEASVMPDLLKMKAIEVSSQLVCIRCNNQDLKLFARIPSNNQELDPISYCLKCIQMGRLTTKDDLYYLPDNSSLTKKEGLSQLTWEGQLSAEQSRAAQELITNLSDTKKIHMVHAVTGAGKTEIVFPVIDEYLRRAGRVALVSPRIDVCLELKPRLQEAFQKLAISLLYGGAEEAYKYTPLVVSTSHQLLRFKEAFDLIIVDEVDAFPFAGDPALNYALERAVKADNGKLIYLTATPSIQIEELIKEGKIRQTILPARYHGHPLPEPSFKWIGNWREAIIKESKYSKLWKLILAFLNIEGIKLIFMPHIGLARKLYHWISTEKPDYLIELVYAQDPQRKSKVMALRNNQLESLITTTILERGVTFTNCHVLILGAEHPQFTKSSLVQMSGRVGRRPDYPSGELIYGHFGKSFNMVKARKEIQEMNQLAKKMGLIK